MTTLGRLRLLTEYVQWDSLVLGRAATVEDFQKVIKAGQVQIDSWSGYAGEVLNEIDTSKDGLIDREEFSHYVKENPFVVTAVLGCTNAKFRTI